FFSSRRRHTRSKRDWSSDVCSSDLQEFLLLVGQEEECLVFEDRTAYRKTVLVVLDRRVESVHGQKGIVRCERIIAVEVIRTAVRSEERRVGKEWSCRRGAGRLE